MQKMVRMDNGSQIIVNHLSPKRNVKINAENEVKLMMSVVGKFDDMG